MTDTSVKSGDKARCKYCGYKGYVYGTPIIGGRRSGTSAPWCPKCGLNNQLVHLNDDDKR